MRQNAIQNYTTANAVRSGYHGNQGNFSNNRAVHGNTQYDQLRYSMTSTSNHGDGSQHRAVVPNHPNVSMNGLSYNKVRYMPADGHHTYRGAGRARLAEEARRSQFGISSTTGTGRYTFISQLPITTKIA